MTFLDMDEVRALRESAKRLREKADSMTKYRGMIMEESRLRDEADRLDFRADEIERSCGEKTG